MPKVITSLVCPVRSERRNIRRVFNALRPINGNTEALFIEGNSSDDTWEVAKTFEGKKNKFGVRFHAYKQKGKGKAEAVATGFDRAKGKYLIIVDADLSVPHRSLVKIIQLFKRYGDKIIASGNRLLGLPKPKAFYWINYAGNYFFRYYYSWLLRENIRDISCGSKAMTKATWKKLKALRSRETHFDRWGDIDWLYYGRRLKLPVKFADVEYKERLFDESKLQNMATRWKFAFHMFWIGTEIVKKRPLAVKK